MHLACSKFGNRALSTFSISWNDPKLPFVANPSNGNSQPKAAPAEKFAECVASIS